MNVILYGIPNCDSVKKARVALSQAGWTVDFHDFKKQGVPAERLSAWMEAVGWEPLLNRQGTTWRQLDAAAQAGAVDATGAARLMQDHPSLIKRPVVEWPQGRLTVGWPAVEQALKGQ